jgi:predicted Zn-dependent protease
MPRLEQLEEMLAADPDDKFLQYALAMELRGQEQLDRSVEIFLSMTKGDPPHVPAFFMGGQVLVMLDRIEEAQTLLQAGIEQADIQGDSHAAGEMRQFLASLE